MGFPLSENFMYLAVKPPRLYISTLFGSSLRLIVLPLGILEGAISPIPRLAIMVLALTAVSHAAFFHAACSANFSAKHFAARHANHCAFGFALRSNPVTARSRCTH